MKLSLRKFHLLPIAMLIAALATAFKPAPEGPSIIRQPEDEMVRAGSDTMLSIEASRGETYQWLRNGIPVQGEIRPVLNFRRIDIKDAGNYACIVSARNRSATTRAASLMVYTRKHNADANASRQPGTPTPMSAGDPFQVWVSPVTSSGTLGSCPGSYAGYVYYSTGWTPVSGLSDYSAADENGRMDTIVRYIGNRNDHGCAQTVVSIPAAPVSTTYRFYIYFPSNVPTTNYPITLTGFNP